MLESIKRRIGKWLANYLSEPLPGYRRFDSVGLEAVAAVLEPGDILLVEGNSRISTAIKYLTQSTWSHAALYVGTGLREFERSQGRVVHTGAERIHSLDASSLLEADLQDGVILVPLSKYSEANLRICRPVGLRAEDREALLQFVGARLGYRYDLKNIVDLMRYLIQTPSVPPQYRRRMITLGSGEPTRAICSTLIAQAFQSIHYPILPSEMEMPANTSGSYFLKRDFTHYVPRDFDVSPYFRVVKPTIELGFDYREMKWGDRELIAGPRFSRALSQGDTEKTQR